MVDDLVYRTDIKSDSLDSSNCRGEETRMGGYAFRFDQPRRVIRCDGNYDGDDSM